MSEGSGSVCGEARCGESLGTGEEERGEVGARSGLWLESREAEAGSTVPVTGGSGARADTVDGACSCTRGGGWSASEAGAGDMRGRIASLSSVARLGTGLDAVSRVGSEPRGEAERETGAGGCEPGAGRSEVRGVAEGVSSCSERVDVCCAATPGAGATTGSGCSGMRAGADTVEDSGSRVDAVETALCSERIRGAATAWDFGG